MSRVFEALTRAARERGVATDFVADSTSHEVPVVPAAVPNFNHTDLAAGQGMSTSNRRHSGAPPAESVTMPEKKSWREKFEEFVFGWDVRRYSAHPIVALEDGSPAAEQYKILREQLRRLRADRGIRTVAITSPVKRDGKTTVAVNLAAAMALDYDEKVILIDADFRAPGVHYYFSGPGAPGLTDYLSSNSRSALNSIFRDTQLSRLQIVPAGQPSRFASELLAHEKMKHLLEQIRAEMPRHTIIIDSPPVLATPDPLVLSRHVDGIIVVVRAGKTAKQYVMQALSSFEPSKIIGVVLNGAELGLDYKYYQYNSRNRHD